MGRGGTLMNDEGSSKPEGRPVRRPSLVWLVRAGREPCLEIAQAARVALFGSSRGPTLAKLRRVYQADEMAAALDAYLASGARPLRNDVAARLSRPLTPLRPGSQ